MRVPKLFITRWRRLKAAADAVSECLSRLDAIRKRRLYTDHDVDAGQQRFERWCEVTKATLRNSVSQDEAARFEGVRSLSITRDPIADLSKDLDGKAAYLAALKEDIKAGRYEFISRPEPTKTRSTKLASEDLEKVTLRWLFSHVRVTFWMWAGGILITAFVIGFKVGRNDWLRTLIP